MHLEHGNTEDGGEEAKAGGELHGRGGTGLLLDRDGGRCIAGRAVSSGGLDLTVRNLGDNSSGGRGLDLTIGDLADWCDRGGSRSLNLAVGDLANWRSGGGRCLDLAVGDLRHWCWGGLDLAVGDLAHWGDGRAGDLTIGDLTDRRDGGAGDLAVRNLRGSGRAAAGSTNDIDVDWHALAGIEHILVVQVVEVATQARLELVIASKSEAAVFTDRPAGGDKGTSLRRSIELELAVCCNVAGAALGVGEDTAGEAEREDLRLAL